MDEINFEFEPANFPESWVAFERGALKAWVDLNAQSHTAARLLLLLSAHMKSNQGVIMSRATMAAEMGVHVRTVTRALDVLRDGSWLEVRYVAGSGTVYVLNSRAVWSMRPDRRHVSRFTATVVLAAEEQPDQAELGAQEPLKVVPEAVVEEPPF